MMQKAILSVTAFAINNRKGGRIIMAQRDRNIEVLQENQSYINVV